MGMSGVPVDQSALTLDSVSRDENYYPPRLHRQQGQQKDNLRRANGCCAAVSSGKAAICVITPLLDDEIEVCNVENTVFIGLSSGLTFFTTTLFVK